MVTRLAMRCSWKLQIRCEFFCETDIVARLGGDEFAIIMPDPDGKEKIVAPASKLIKALSTPMEAVGHKVQIGTSIGVAIYPYDGQTIETLVTNADDALCAAKEAGRNTYRLHEAEKPNPLRILRSFRRS
jgi:diguanylate cyclase (GGDEF)-like protein